MAGNRGVQPVELDSLRVLALGRIPRCSRCPRYEALRLAVRREASACRALPGVPRFCTYQVCAPLARRFDSVPFEMGEISTAS